MRQEIMGFWEAVTPTGPYANNLHFLNKYSREGTLLCLLLVCCNRRKTVEYPFVCSSACLSRLSTAAAAVGGFIVICDVLRGQQISIDTRWLLLSRNESYISNLLINLPVSVRVVCNVQRCQITHSHGSARVL